MAAEASAQITELAADDHACLTFGENEELFDLTAAFVRDGLAAGLKVMWLSDAAPPRRWESWRAAGSPPAAVGARADDRGRVRGRLLSGQVFRADAAVGG